MSVSYTHLDVYKRQAFLGFGHYQINSIKKLYGVENVTYETLSNTTAMPSRITREAYGDLQEKAETDPDAFQDQGYLDTVSYTHLDVYKRQHPDKPRRRKSTFRWCHIQKGYLQSY